jgi:4-hydroxybenzoate polyprenyltransferase
MFKKTSEYLKKTNFFNLSLTWLIITPIIISHSFSFSFAKSSVFMYCLKLFIIITNAIILKAIAITLNDLFTTKKTTINKKEKLQLICILSAFLFTVSFFINNLYLFYNIAIIIIFIAAFYLNSKINKNYTLPFIANLGAFIGWTINQDTYNILSLFIYFSCLFISINFLIILNHKEKNSDVARKELKELKINLQTHIKKFLLLSYSLSTLLIALIGSILGTTNLFFIAIIITQGLFLLQIKFIDNEKFDKHIFIANKYYALIIFIGIMADKL